ncbi:T-cell surface protein tactile isoform X2 [Sturnira hondurensis]|uniref:T-cell surface protein tactile isoform X2 n=1 Tax=Sturnira hondurensis TaxID=192404 RepID=UPI001879BB1A|nr:T-cell surface protein tactile isoform X2 [Sturnira hondurensis]
MEKRWTYCAVYSIIQIHFVRGVWEGKFNAGGDVYALPGSDVNLTCQTQKKSFLIQTQWSKELDLIALYHPQHGFHCQSGVPCKSLVTFKEIPGNVIKWTLHLRNMNSSLSGKYECSFILYPEGIQTKIYNLLIPKNVTQDEWRSNNTKEVELNQTLEIPCFQNITSEISAEFAFAWLVEGNGTQETLITQGQPVSNSTSFKDRVKLGADYGLYLSPVQIHDNDRKFSCHVTIRPGKTLRSSTTVKVFAKPEISMIMENNSMGKRTFTCSLRNVFPTANLTWFTDSGFPPGERKETYIPNEERKDKSGFLNMKSVFTSGYGNNPAQAKNLTIWCMALIPVPGNKVRNISSEKITFSLGSVNPPTDPVYSVTESALHTQPSPATSMSPTGYPATSSNALVDVSASSTANNKPQTSNSHVTAQGFNSSWTSSRRDVETSSWMPSETHSSFPSGAGSTPHGDITSTSKALSEVPTTANRSTKNNHVHITGAVANKPKGGMSWPVIVAALLFFCLVLFGLGMRKWCQYQREIMERPPPFKPPPPPIKYTCIQESTGSDLPCHEMETL